MSEPTISELGEFLTAFAAAFDLRCNAVAHGFANETQQEIALLYDPLVMTARHDPKGDLSGSRNGAEPPRFDGTFRIDLDIDSTEDQVRRVFEDAGITFLHSDKGEGVLIDVTKAKKAK